MRHIHNHCERKCKYKAAIQNNSHAFIVMAQKISLIVKSLKHDWNVHIIKSMKCSPFIQKQTISSIGVSDPESSVCLLRLCQRPLVWQQRTVHSTVNFLPPFRTTLDWLSGKDSALCHPFKKK